MDKGAQQLLGYVLGPADYCNPGVHRRFMDCLVTGFVPLCFSGYFGHALSVIADG